MIYDVSENLEDPEFSLSLSTKKKSRNVIAFPGDEPKDEKSHMVDFCFCTQDRLEDFRFLSVFFMNSHGEIYYYAPIILGKIAVDEVELLDLKRRTFEKWEGTDDAPECDEYYKALFDCLLTNSSLEHTKLVLKSVANTPYESLNNKNSIQGYYLSLSQSNNLGLYNSMTVIPGKFPKEERTMLLCIESLIKDLIFL